MAQQRQLTFAELAQLVPQQRAHAIDQLDQATVRRYIPRLLNPSVAGFQPDINKIDEDGVSERWEALVAAHAHPHNTAARDKALLKMAFKYSHRVQKKKKKADIYRGRGRKNHGRGGGNGGSGGSGGSGGTTSSGGTGKSGGAASSGSVQTVGGT